MALEFKLLNASLKLYRSEGNSPGLALSLYYLLVEEGSPPDPLPLETAWLKRSGAYVLLPTAQPITDPAAFVAALHKLLQPSPQSQWIAWIPNPQPVGGELREVRLLRISKQVDQSEGRTTGGTAGLWFGNLALSVPGESIVGLDTAGAAPAFEIRNDPTIGSTLSLVQTGTTRQMEIPSGTRVAVALTGPRLGAWTFPLAINRGELYQVFQRPDDFSAAPSAEVRYTYAAGTAQELRYPVLLGAVPDPRNPPKARLPLRVAIDPLHPLDSALTRFELDLPAFGGDGPELPVSLSFRTTAGHDIQLKPLAGAGFAFARRVGNPANPQPPFFLYLTPAGPFEATTAPQALRAGEAAVPSPIAEGALLVMCGLYGTEFLLAAEEDRLELSGEQPAGANGFPGPVGRPVLDGSFSSAWLKLVPGPKSGTTFKGPIKQSYCVQAPDAVYFHKSTGFPFPVAVGARLGDLSDPARTRPFPMAPYGWVYFSDPDREIENPNPGISGQRLTDYENQVLSLARRDAIAVDRCLGPLYFDLATLTPFAGGFVQTPRGLLVELNDGSSAQRPAGTWKRLILARGPEIPDQWLQYRAGTSPTGCTGAQGPFEVVSPFLSTALLSSAPFVVITRPEPMGVFDSAMRLGEFPFRITVSGTDAGPSLGNNTVLIFKLAPGRPLADLADDVAAWTDSATFVGDGAQTRKISGQIHQFIAEAQRLSDEARERGAFDYFANFLALVKSPSWSGVLALNTPLDLKELPTDLKALLGGMRGDRPLRGHHFGINVNQIRRDATGADGAPPLDKSSLFALVHYDQAFQAPTTDFDFQVLNLNALFDNSTLQRFESQIAFSVRTLFNDPVRLTQGGKNDRLATNTIVIDGALQVQDGKTSVVFATDEIRIFQPAQGSGYRALSEMAVTQAGLDPVRERAEGDAVIVDSSFVFNGALGFNVRSVSGAPPADLFSFGLQSDDPGTGLAFSSYSFAMTTTVRNNQGTLAPIRLDLLRLTLDDSEATPRENSLFATLPVKLVRFRLNPPAQAAGSRRVEGIGLDSVDPEFALELQLVMGTLGALSSQSPLQGFVLLGWRSAGSLGGNDTVGMLFVPPQEMANSSGFKIQAVVSSFFGKVRLDRPKLTKESSGKSIYVFTLALVPVNFAIVGLPLIPLSAIRSLTFFGDFESIGSEDGTNLAWFVGEPLRSSAAPETRALARPELVGEWIGLPVLAKTQSELIFTPALGVIAGLKPKIDPQATQVVNDAIEKLSKIPLGTATTLNAIYNDKADLPVSYDPGAGVTVWIDIQFINITFQAIFSDPAVYGGRIAIKEDDKAKGILKSLGGLELEIAYRRISSELGAWSASLTLPAKFRKIEISDNYKLFLPVVGVVIYTNGDWRVDAGWPFDPGTALRLEFTVQGVPLQAAIGFFLAKLRSADNPDAFGDEFALIWSFGLGISFGVGKSFDKGPASLEVGAYLFLILSGFLASKHGALTQYGVDYYWFAGQLGARLYGSGSVDFKIIKASLDIEAVLVLSLALETRHSTVLDLRFKFSVSLTIRIVIVKISFSFSAEFTLFSVTFGSGPKALTDGPTPTAVPPSMTLRRERLLSRRLKELDPRLVRPLQTLRASLEVEMEVELAAQVDVRLCFLLQTTAVETGAAASAPQTVASLLIKLVPDGTGIDDFARLVQGVGVWLATQFGGPPPLLDQLARIQKKIDDGSFAASLVDCLSSQFRFLLVPATGNLEDEDAAIFPMFPQLKMTYHGAGIPFDLPLVPPGYPGELARYFAQLATVPSSANTELAVLATAGVPQSVAGIVFSDFFDVLGRQLVSELEDLAEADPELTFAEALARLGPEGYANIAGAVSRFAQYGLAMPTPDSQPFGSKLAGVYQLTRQQVALVQGEGGAWDTKFSLGYGTIDVKKWIVFGADGKLESISETMNPKLVLTEKINPAWLTTGGGFRQLAPIRSVDEIFYLGDVRTWTRADGSQANLRALPDALQLAVDARAPLDATVQVVPDTPELNLVDETLEVLPAAAVLFVTLQLRQIPSVDGGEPLQGVYQLVGTDEATRARIEELLRIGVAGATLNMLAPLGNSAYRSSVKDSSIVLAKTNLSTLSQPPSLFRVAALAEAPPPPPDHARLADVEKFLRLVWELSVVHSGGFFLYMSDLPADAFESGRADIALLVTFGSPVQKPRLERNRNMLLLTSVPPRSTLGVTVADGRGQTLQRWEPNHPGGWVGFEIQWPSPPTEPGLPESPTPAQKAKYLEALYSILQYRVEAVQASESRLLRVAGAAPVLPSNWSLPIGQQQTDGWSYRQTLPVARFLGQPNRYAGIGLAARFGVRLIDLYGNSLPVLNPVPVKVIYNDPLTPLGGWPGTESTYVFTADTGNRALLHVLLTLRPQVPGTDAGPDAQWALQARLTYELVRDQLSDPNARSAVVTVLSAQPLGSDTSGRPVKERLLSYIGDVVLPYLDKVIGGQTPPLPPPFEVLLGVDRGHVAELDDDIFQLDLSLEIWRDPSKVDPVVREAMPTVQSVSSPLAPVALTALEASVEPPGKDDTLRAFAESFERAWAGFKGGQGLLKLAEGAEAQADRKGGSSRQLWAVRWGRGAGLLAGFPNAGSRPTVDDLPVSFSQIPLSTQLITNTVEVRVYKDPWTGTGADVDKDEPRTFSNIDLDLWGRAFLATFEQILTAGMATAIATLDGTRYTSLVSYKEQLANTLQLSLENVLLVPGQAVDPAVARERFRQALLQSLASNYTLSSVVQIPADVEAARKKEPPIPPNLYGDVNPPQVPDSLAFSLSPAKLATARGRVPMPYLVSTKNPAAQAHLDLGLGYTVTFVEHDFDPARSFFGYVPSSYISFITPLFAPAGGPPPLVLPLGVNRIPIPLRAYPGVPALPAQEPVLPGKPETLAEALRWKYRFTVTGSQSAQDRLTLRVIFNEPLSEAREISPQPLLRSAVAGADDPPRPEPKDLFAALARFTFEYPQIEPYLAKVPGAAFQGKDVAVARKALERFEGLVRGIAATWKTWHNPGLLERQMARRDLRLAAGAGPNLPQERWIYVVDYQKRPALMVTRSIEGSASLPPWLEIEGFRTPPEQGQKTAEYSPLTGSETGLLVVSVPTLYLMTRQSARTTALIERNANLVPPGSPAGTSVNPAFVYTTPVVELQDPVVPLVNVANAISLPPASSLTAAIDQLFDPFVQSGDPSLKVQELRFSLDSFYQYRLAAASGSSDQVLISSAPNFLVREEAATDKNVTGTPPRKLSEVKKEIAAALTAWYKAMQPSDLNAQLRFALTAYSILGAAPGSPDPASELPLVRFSSVLVPVPPNKPSWWNG